MKTFRFLWNNLFDAGTVTSSSAAASYPLANLKHQWYSKYFRTTGKASEWVACDLGSAPAVRAFVVKGHNLTTGATYKVQADDDPGFGSLGVDETIVITAEMVTREIIPCIFEVDKSYQYWRFTVVDGSNPDSYLKFGRVFIGSYFEPTLNFNQEYSIKMTDYSAVQYSTGGQMAASKKGKLKEMAYSWQYLSQADRNTLMDIYEVVGRTECFFICQDADDADHNTYYVQNLSDWEMKHEFNDIYFSFSLSIREVM